MVRASKITDGNKPIDRNTYNPLIDDYARRLQVPASYVVWEQDSTYYADHCFGTGMDYSNTSLQTVWDAIRGVWSEGAVLCFKPENTFTTDGTLTVDERVIINAYGATFESIDGSFIFHFDNLGNPYNTSATCRHLSGFYGGKFLDTADVNSLGILIEDSSGISLRDINFADYNTAIEVEDADGFCESTIMKNIGIYSEGYGIRFNRTGAGTSFAQTHLEDIFINIGGTVAGPNYGIYIPTGSMFTRCHIKNYVFWLGGNNTVGLYTNGNMTDSHIQFGGESEATAVSVGTAVMTIGAAATFGIGVSGEMPSSLSWWASADAGCDFAALINNPNNIRYCDYEERYFDIVEPDDSYSQHKSRLLADDAVTTYIQNLDVPNHYVSLIGAYALLIPGGTGNVRVDIANEWCSCDEAHNTGSDTIAYTDVAVVAGEMECWDISAAFDGIAAGDKIGVRIRRDAIHANDTVEAGCHLVGFRLRYVSNER